MSQFPLEKKVRKIQQLVWLDPGTFSKILKISADTGIAPNVVISSIVKSAIDGYEPVKVIERCPVFSDEEVLKKKCLFYRERVKNDCK